MQYGTSEWQDWALGEEEVIHHIKASYDVGINTFNTADTYSNFLMSYSEMRLKSSAYLGMRL
ncbi:hypothetical protein BDR06DRAFT_951519 [Suillus hirtellus]|nr:hypothetical protein BDR06DRAFT_951519 [Suillus hirtellus]